MPCCEVREKLLDFCRELMVGACLANLTLEDGVRLLAILDRERGLPQACEGRGRVPQRQRNSGVVRAEGSFTNGCCLLVSIKSLCVASCARVYASYAR